MKRFAILGHPVSHSRSPELHNAVFQALSLDDHRYEFCDTEPADLEQLMDAFREGDYEGFSVTIPHKKAVMEYCDELSERAKSVGAVNTLLRVPSEQFSIFNFQFSEEKEYVIYGDNTDYLGFERSLGEQSRVEGRGSRALVLGAGGAAKAVVAVLVDHGFQVVVASRRKDLKEHKDLKDLKDVSVKHYDDLEPEGDWGMIVNTTPVGMANDQKTMTNQKESRVESPESSSPPSTLDDTLSKIDTSALLLKDSRWYTAERTYVDIVYTPKMTPFLLKAQEAGGKIVTGDRMFFWQALEQAKMFTGASEEEISPIITGL